jgi:hypothetical protein
MHQLIHDKGGIKMLGFLNKSKTPGHCIFPLANPHSGESLHSVPKSNHRYRSKIIVYLLR